MITRIEIDGFKSLREFSLNLEPLTAIVGPNGAGKSNLLDALRLLSLLTETRVTDALKAGRGTIRDQFSRLLHGPSRQMRLCAEVLVGVREDEAYFPLGHAQTRVRHEIEIELASLPSGAEDLSVVRESIVTLRSAEDTWTAAHPAFAPLAKYEDDDNVVIRLEPNESPFEAAQRVISISHLRENVHSRMEVGRRSSMLSMTPGGFLDPIVGAVADELRGLRFVHLEPARLRDPSERASGPALAADGSNLPTALLALAPDVRAQIRADLAELVPGFRSFEVVPSDDELRLEIEFTDGARVPARVLSDGTLRLVALLTLLRGSRPGTLIAVEEPENGIHPGRLRALVEKLVEATRPQGTTIPPQVLLTSHSPAILAALRDRPEALVFADLIRRGDELRSTRMRRIGDGPPRDPTTVARREIDRILEAARPEEEE